MPRRFQGSAEPHPGQTSAALVESVDVFPTLAELCGLPMPAGVDGRSLRPQLLDPHQPSAKPACGFWSSSQRTVRTDRWRLIAQQRPQDVEPRLELFDYQTDPDETRNHAASNPEIVTELLKLLERSPRPD